MTNHPLPDRPAWATALLSAASWTLLLDLVATALQRRGRTVLAISEQGFRLVDPRTADGTAQLGLYSLAHRAAEHAPSKWPEIIEHLLDVLDAVDPAGVMDGLTREQLRLRVVVPGSLMSQGFLLREFAPGLGVALVADAGETLSYLDTQEAATRLGLDRADLERAGVDGLLANSEPHLVPVDAAPFPLFHVAMKAADEASYAASALLCLKQLGVDPGLGAIVAAPASGACFVSPLDAETPWERLGPLFAFVREIANSSQHPLPPALFWWHDGYFEPIEAASGEHEGQAAIVVVPPQSLLLRYGDPSSEQGERALLN